MNSLLSSDEPSPFELLNENGPSPFFFTADHAGRYIPKTLGDLGVPASELERHIAWDIGIAEVTRRLATRLNAYAILQPYSRLVIDCNRPPEVDSSIVDLSEHTEIPGNRDLSTEQRHLRRQAIFEPYHARIEAALSHRERAGRPTILIAMHSFTPCYKGATRVWECGVLYNRDNRLALRVKDALQNEGLVVGDNEPYFVSDDSDYGVPHYGERRGNVHVELEVRQDLIADAVGQQRWCELLERALPVAAAPFLGS